MSLVKYGQEHSDNWKIFTSHTWEMLGHQQTKYIKQHIFYFRDIHTDELVGLLLLPIEPDPLHLLHSGVLLRADQLQAVQPPPPAGGLR